MNLSRLKRWTVLISSFLAGQGSVQILNLISGFLLLRWLSVEAYAQYSVAFGFQSTLALLVDLGVSGSIVALVGDRASDKEVVGSYIRAAKHFRNRLFALIIPLSMIAFPLLSAKHNWHWTTQLLLFVSIISSLFFQGWVSYYSVPLLMHQRLKEYYQPQIFSSGSRVVLCYILYLVSALSAWTAAWVNSAVMAMNGFFYRQNSASLIAEPNTNDPKTNREMLSYIFPLIPAVIFMAFYNQNSIFMITLFGQAKSIAEVGALSRISQLFFILSAFNSVIIAPYIAKVLRQHLARRYFQVLGVAIAIATALSFLGFLFPQPLLWILGRNYQHLRVEIGWMVSVECINYVAGVMWTMHSARKWVYLWGSFLSINLLLSTQTICLLLMDLSTTINVIYFSLFTALSGLLFHTINAVFGFIYGPSASLNTSLNVGLD